MMMMMMMMLMLAGAEYGDGRTRAVQLSERLPTQPQ